MALGQAPAVWLKSVVRAGVASRNRYDCATGAVPSRRPDEEGQMNSKARVLLYSDDRTTREQVRLALGKRVAADLPKLEIFEVATLPIVLQTLDAGGIDLVILDGEATPAGGIGVCHQIKNEVVDCPPVLLLVAREADAWLATWSRADGIQGYPLDPMRLPVAVAALLRGDRSEEASA